jgi:glutamate/tyrosine decarboxylase-like PLP-dependent enzyme
MDGQVVDWCKEMIGFPASASGTLVSGGSMASLTALAVARHTKAGFDVRCQGLQKLERKLVLYISEEGHGCLRKAAELLGIGSENIRTVAVDAHFRLRVDNLIVQIEADLAAGYQPFAVVASAGTVNTGATDPLQEIAEVCRRHDLWLHIDGAYGAPAILTSQYRDELAAIAFADSIAVAPHKWLSIPVEAGLVLVKDAQAMRDTFSLVPPYLRTDGSLTGVGGLPWFSEYGFQQTRGFRALKVWMALKHYGTIGYTQMLEDHIELARYLHSRVMASPDLEAMAPVGLSVVCFRYAPAILRGARARLDTINKALLERLQLGGQVFLSSTVLRGSFVLRACILNYQTQRADMDFLVDLVLREGADVLREQRC